MSLFLDYISTLDASSLKASEVSQCLLYLNYASKHHPEWERQIAPIKERLNKRLQELRQSKNNPGSRPSN